MTNRESDFFQGFSWAVPKAFRIPLSTCWFEEGDLLFDHEGGYTGATWDECLNYITYGIQILSPKKGFLPISESDHEADSLIFKNNWNKSLELQLIDYRSQDKKITFLKTSQGKFFTFLRYGDFSILTEDSNPPEIPMLIGDIKKNHIDKAEKFIRNSFEEEVNYNNLFIMGYDQCNYTSINKCSNIKKILTEQDFSFKIIDYSPEACGLDGCNFSPLIRFRCISIETKRIEKVRDCIKKALWTQRKRNVSLIDYLKNDQGKKPFSFNIERHGKFVPYIVKKHGDIRTHSFDHSPLYRYRLAIKKINFIPSELCNFLYSVFENCPNHFFGKDNIRASRVTLDIPIKSIHKSSHKLIKMANESRDTHDYKSRHENLQKYFLEQDRHTIATEVPVWIECGEFSLDYEKIFSIKKEVTGHIDLLRFEENGNIGVWDYKPNACDETKATAQVLLYTIMLSVRTGIPFKKFTCGYFDETDLFYIDNSSIKFEELEFKQEI